jgi:phosphoethanolamine N-methyltransferase
MAGQSNAGDELQKFLDANQYSRKSILRYEKIFGKTYVSTGGEATTAEFCAQMGLEPGMKLLDVGAGIGGSAFYMAKSFGITVDGVDLSSNMVEIARENLAKMSEEVQKKVTFRVEDATTMEYPENHYDVVYSRDTILHIADKKSLFQNFFKTLKPGGRVVITDYCRGDLAKAGKADYGQDFKDYVADRGYHLLTVEQYGQVSTSKTFSLTLMLW